MRRTLALFNTLTRRVDPVVPILDGQVSLYTCGPTVYNYAHIGNLRTFLFQDLLKRTFRAAGHEVRHCMNITDVEDKIIRDSQGALPADASNAERHGAMTALTDRFTAIFLEDLDTLRIQRADFLPKATTYVPHMIRLIQALEAKGLAYVREGSVYYRIAGLPQYGCLAHLDREGMQAGASVDADEYERDSVT
ncbi:MAG: cysteine--tRNA ligase, partial [Geothrix sp.]|nr:cysteine--tRNA ligase [Geothrix sp.]